MIEQQQNTTNRWKISLAVILSLALCWYCIRLLQEQPRASWLWVAQQFGQWRSLGLGIVFLVLAVANWSLEALKWQSLLRPYFELSLQQAFKAVLVGNAWAPQTPNRMGEWWARSWAVPPQMQSKVVGLAVVNSYTQLGITLFMGGLSWLIIYWQQIPVVYSHFGGAVAVILLLLWVFVGKQLPFGRKWEKKYQWVKYLPQLPLQQTVNWRRQWELGFLRYMVFIGQYALCFYWMGITVGGLTTVWTVSLLLWCLTVLPTIGWLEWGVRGAMIVAVMAPLSLPTIPIVAASLLIWVGNVVAPALAGTLLLFAYKRSCA